MKKRKSVSPKLLNKIAISRIQEQSLVSKRASISWMRNEGLRQYNLIALIPVWNADKWLSKSLNALIGSVDAIIALDDGSTDHSLQLLEEHELVIEIIKKPEKILLEWHDAQNHFELYSAAKKYQPEWLIFIDADEILENTFKVFKPFMLTVSKYIKAFAFHVAEIDGDVVIRKKFAHRMFRYRDNYTFDNKRLHCRPLPLEITLDEIKLVNVRLLHKADEPTRNLRFEKYVQADPNLIYQTSYNHLLNKFFSEDIMSMGAQLTLTSLIEDGLQRRLQVRKITRFNKLFLDEEKLKRLIEIFYKTLQSFINTFELYLRANLDAYLIAIGPNSKLVAQYSYDSSKDISVNISEAWLIEEMHHHRDFFLTLAKLHLIERSKSIQNTIDRIDEILEALIRSGVLKLKDI